MDISQPITKSFNISLRYLQLGIQLLISQLLSKLNNTNCSTTLITIGLPISYILIILNIIAIVLIKWKKIWNRRVFFVLFGVNVVLAGVCMVVGLGGIGQSNSCAGNRVVHRFVGFQSFLGIVIGGIVLFGPLDMVVRWSNAPGNLVWPFLFFGLDWNSGFKAPYIIVGVINLLISITTFALNLSTFNSGLTLMKSKIIRYGWIGGIALMVICEIIVLGTLLGNSGAQQFNDTVGKKLAQTFFPINIIDLIFWLWGLLTLKNISNDIIRDNIMKQDKQQDDNDLDYMASDHKQQGTGLGTIR